MIYTSYEMVRDCREGRPEGWRYFITHYVPVVRKLSAHYAPEVPAAVEQIVGNADLFTSIEPTPERPFVAALRQQILARLPARSAEVFASLDDVAAGLAPLTLLEKQAAWIESMRYGAAETGAMLRMSAETVEKVRTKAADLLRAHLSAWSRSVLPDNGLQLAREAAAGHTKDCPPSKGFLDVLDGRTTWSGRDEMERHVGTCWHCIDHFCRMAEVIELLRGIQPLADEEASPYLRSLGVEEKRKHWWGR